MKTKLYPALRALRKTLAFFGKKVTESYNSMSLTHRVIEGDLLNWRNHQESQTVLSEYWQLLQAEDLSDALVPSILDFGGGGGRHGFLYVREGKAKWTVLETSEMTAAAHDLLGEVPIDFVDNIDVLVQEQKLFDALFCRSAFQYTTDPLGMVKFALSLTKKLVVLEKLVLHEGNNSIQIVQISFLADNLAAEVRTWRDYFHVAEYPLTGISLEAFKRLLAEEFEIIRFEKRPPASHLPSYSHLAEYDVVAVRKSQ